jgi:ACS family glucarate transporter-like MFS transporter
VHGSRPRRGHEYLSMNLPLGTLVRPTVVRYKVLGWACALSMITYVDRVCIKYVAPEIRSALDLSMQEWGWVFAAFGLAYSLFEIPSGWLGDRFGPRRVLCRIVLCWSVFTALTGLVWKFSVDSGYVIDLPWSGHEIPLLFNSLVLLVIIRFLFGAGEAGAYPNIARALRNWFPYRRRGLAQGLPWTFGRWGGALSPLLVTFFASWFGWRGAFLAFGIMGILWVAAFAYFFRDSPAQHPGVNEAERALILGGARESVTPPPISWPAMLRSPTLWCLSLMYFCSNAGWCFFITWDVEYFKNVLHLQETDLEIASGAPLFCGGVACLLGGLGTDRLVRILGRRWGRTLQGLVSYAFGGLFFLLALMTTEPWLAVSCLCAASFCKDFAMAVSWSTCVDIGHRYAGTVGGFMNSVGNMGTAVSPLIVEALARNNEGQWKWALVYSAAMLFSAALGWAFINPRKVVVYSPEDRKALRAQGVLD